jgi:GTP-binding protein HflX
LGNEIIHKKIEFKPQLGKLRALLYSASAILNEQTDEQGQTIIEIRMQKSDYNKLLRLANVQEHELVFLEI